MTEFSRRTLLGGLLVGTGAIAWGLASGRRPTLAQIGLYSEAVAFTGVDSRELIPAGRSDLLIPGTRIHTGATDVAALRQQQDTWLEHTASWVESSQWSDLARSSLLDLWSLRTPAVLADGTTPMTTTVAAWSPYWRYVWPRDGAHVAAALTVCGKVDQAVEQLLFFQGRQREDGWFEARYHPAMLGVPDQRQPQLDGLGWLLWSIRYLLETPEPLNHLKRLRPLIDHCSNTSIAVTSSGLPPVSPDYWEMNEKVPVLGVSAPLLAGLISAREIYESLGESERAIACADAAEMLAENIHSEFGRDGYPRHLGRRHRDTAVAFLLPPYTDTVHPDVWEHHLQARREMTQPAGGVTPGSDWTRDGVSWTPETAVFAMVAAAGDDWGRAAEELTWLSDHRTDAGAHPEKILADGSPAAVAPLGWTAAVALLTIHELERRPTG